ncbi:DNA-binding response regulator [Paracoccus suum]|uniref:DNA-binding response regulator n=1 Tax=Paracoccus suum TaxID=2259340 RepID=A0A344PGY2_9RHOB|nr:response regulator transcription factor [Paracoccus suum]AXC48637.1 DNA-binding response regulator [Paracoccus suum]
MRILLIEDDEGIGAAVRDRIAADGHLPDWMTTLDDADACMSAMSYDLVLLDLMLPDGDGLAFLRRLRAAGHQVPVIVMTARDRISERIAGLDAGADDYLVKPFDLAELSARIGAVARRYGGNPSPIISLGACQVDLARRRVTGPDGPVEVGRREWIVLETLIARAGRFVSRAQIEDRIYSFEEGAESNTVEVYISRLRRKLGRSAIETQRGVGYRIAP